MSLQRLYISGTGGSFLYTSCTLYPWVEYTFVLRHDLWINKTKQKYKPTFRFASPSEDLWAHVHNENLSLRELKQSWSFKIKLEIALSYLKFPYGLIGTSFHTLSRSRVSTETEVATSADYVILLNFISYKLLLCFEPNSHLSHPETRNALSLYIAQKEVCDPCGMIGECNQRRCLLAASVQTVQC